MPETTLETYAALAETVHALLSDPDPASLRAPPEVRRMLAQAAYRLAVYVSAMPGAQGADRDELADLRAMREALGAPRG
jgi:hypothetical protein